MLTVPLYQISRIFVKKKIREIMYAVHTKAEKN